MASDPTFTDGVTLALGTIQGWSNDFYTLLPTMIVGTVAFILIGFIGLGLSKSVAAYFKRKDRIDLGRILASFTFWAFVFVGFMVSITIIIPSIKPVDLLASFGLGSLAIGFAFKDILQNWLAGLLILLRTPFRRGDQIKVDTAEGTVLRIEPRATIIQTFDGRDIVVPNTTIYTNIVTIQTSQLRRRVEIDLTVGYEHDIRFIMTIINSSLSQIDEVLKDPAPQILCWELGATSLGIKLRWWIHSQRSAEVVSRSRVVQAIKEAFEANEIDPTDPQLIYFRNAGSGYPQETNPPGEGKEAVKAGPVPSEIEISSADPEAEKPKLETKDQTLLS